VVAALKQSPAICYGDRHAAEHSFNSNHLAAAHDDEEVFMV